MTDYDAGFAAGIEAAVGECGLRDCGDSLIEALRTITEQEGGQ